MVLDWLYDTVSAEQLCKLEIYTFGNAANHWNAPVISGASGPLRTSKSHGARGESATEQRIIQHVEHYANEGEYVSKFGILHFRPDQANPQTSNNGSSTDTHFQYSSKPGPTSNVAKIKSAPSDHHLLKLQTHIKKSATWTTSPKTPIERDELQAQQEKNRFFGCLFKRAASGHLLNMHYLDCVFEMEGVDHKDRTKGRVKDGNQYMDAWADMGYFERFDTVQAIGNGQPQGPSATRRNAPARKQIKELSRLWTYRNGQSPAD